MVLKAGAPFCSGFLCSPRFDCTHPRFDSTNPPTHTPTHPHTHTPTHPHTHTPTHPHTHTRMTSARLVSAESVLCQLCLGSGNASGFARPLFGVGSSEGKNSGPSLRRARSCVRLGILVRPLESVGSPIGQIPCWLLKALVKPTSGPKMQLGSLRMTNGASRHYLAPGLVCCCTMLASGSDSQTFVAVQLPLTCLSFIVSPGVEALPSVDTRNRKFLKTTQQPHRTWPNQSEKLWSLLGFLFSSFLRSQPKGGLKGDTPRDTPHSFPNHKLNQKKLEMDR